MNSLGGLEYSMAVENISFGWVILSRRLLELHFFPSPTPKNSAKNWPTKAGEK